ncbi:S8 family serine peptidase [Candidatus Nitrosotenuis aquarius]|uniref:S8 family serine peptidase n=1 Tax=Candidatus Nitrosotenuis aquarius TaxID=1846278 RepID=UPI001FE8E0BB|nr:S8 family serine peptidase [Candidatus Nitrosotenuis aquarius]
MDDTKNKTDINSAVSENKMKKTRLLMFCFSLVIIGVFLFSAKVQTDPVSEVLLDKSAKHVGVQYPHNLGFYGKDIKIAVIDTGVDSGHPDLSDKIIGGYDFIENDITAQDTNGHGTEVAGIIAANGKMRGVAPEAKILAYRVSDTGNSVSSDLIVKAIQKAIEDDVDIINLSLGVNRTNDKIEDAINDAVEKGIVVVAAAGNSGPDLRTIGSPGKDPHAITVGATYNNITASLVATLDIDGKRFQVLPMVGIVPLSESLTSEIVFGKYGKESDLAGLDVKDKILLVERGSDIKDELLYFSVKEKNAANAGARAIIVYNNEPGIFLGDLNNKLEGPEYKPRIPAVSMSKEDGHALLSILQNKTTGTINTFYHPDFVSFFSSRGPVSPFYIKPDLVAPGVFVNTTSIQGRYNLTSGTSFAAPHVSGAAAILLEKNPGLSPSQVKAIIISTADPVSDTFGTLFPQEISGVGRLNITRAFDANLAISPSFAIFDLSPFTKSQTLQFKLETINGTRAQPQIEITPASSAVKFDHWIDGTTLFVKAELTEQKTGQYQGSIVISDKVVQRIPILLRISDGAIEVFENDGMLDFKIDSEEKWSYAKISLYNDDGRLVDSISLTPTKDQSITVGTPGKYWVQAELKTENGTASVYNTITVQSANRQTLDIGIPYQPLIILGGIGAIIVLVGLLIRRK